MRKNPFIFDVSQNFVLWNSDENTNVSVIMHDFTGILMYEKNL